MEQVPVVIPSTAKSQSADICLPAGKKIYLACPYTCLERPAWRKARVELANLAAMILIERGYIVFSPISHSHPIAMTAPECATDHDLWLKQDLHFLEWCDFVVVLGLPGWQDSRGVAVEIKWCMEHDKDVHILSLDGLWAIHNGETVEGLVLKAALNNLPHERLYKA